MDSATLDLEARYSVRGYGGVAFYVIGPETQATEDTWWDGIEEPTGNVIAVMVGDDRRHSIDPDDLTMIADEDYCGSCGQIGCGWG